MKNPDKKPARRWWIAGVLGFAAFMTLGLGREFVWAPHYGPARKILDACLFDAAGQPTLASLEAVSLARHGPGTWYDRLTILDLERGVRLAREILPDRTSLIGCGDAFVWLEEDHQPVARDARTGAILASGGELARVAPALATGIHAWEFLPASGELLVRTNGGSLHRIAPRTWVVGPSDEESFSHHRERRSFQVRTSSESRSAGHLLTVNGPGRAQLTVDGQPVALTASETAGLLSAEFLGLPREPLSFADPPSALLLHHPSLAADAPQLLSRLAVNGRLLWTKDLGALKLRYAFPSRTLILVGEDSDEDFTAHALDAKTGAVLWTYGF